MKRHISIFAFLLGAFAAGLASEAAAATAQTVYGGYYYVEDVSHLPDLHRMSIDGLGASYNASNLKEGDAVNFVATPLPGTVISKWGTAKSGSEVIQSNKCEWVDAATLSNPSNYPWSGKPSDGNRWLAVQFAYMPLTITFNGGDGGSGKMDQMTGLNIDSEFTLPANEFTKTGYHFVGWKTNETKGAVFENKATLKGSAFWNGKSFDSTLYAQWATNGYFVGCELNGGAWSAGYNPPARVVYDAVFSLPAPTRTGYDFIGWKVTSGLDATTAKWGTGENPSTPITADTLCANGDKAVYFKNLNPTDNAVVTLTAQWKAKTIRVTFNNEGGSSGGGILDFLDVTYAAAYPALNVPSQGGNLFRGYVIDGAEYWNEKGQPVKPAWDIPTNCTAHAQWEKLDYQLTYDENRSDGSVSKQVSRTFEYGVPTVLYDGADFSNLGCTLLGWSTLKQAEKPDDGCEIGASKTFVSSTILYAVWEKNYFIVYDGNGATNETPMAVQKLVFGKSGQSLNPNIYGKVGYTFDGWATNRAAALLLDKSYEDREIITRDLAKTVGETNTLYATWEANTYYVAFDPNGGTGAAMPVWKRKYDQPVTLPEAAYDHGAYDFIGWSNDVEKIIYLKTDFAKPVSNLCAIANGTNMLYAVWKLSELSAAMHCDNLRWESYAYQTNFTTYVNEWSPEPGGMGVWQTGDDLKKQQWLVTQVPANGMLAFKWRPVNCQGERYSLSYWITQDKDSYFPKEGTVDLKGADNEWHTCIISNVPSQHYVHFYVGSTDPRSYCQINQMTWTPGGPMPGPADAVGISSMEFLDGKFILRFKSSADFDYNLLTNANLLIDSWGVMTNVVGTGGTMYFEPQIIEGQPQMFYRVDTIQRKD